MQPPTPTYELPVVSSWFHGGTKHHIYLKAPLARALGARETETSVLVDVYVAGKMVASGALQGKTWFLSQVEAVFEALDLSAADAGKRRVSAQGRPRSDGRGLDLYLWTAPPPPTPLGATEEAERAIPDDPNLNAPAGQPADRIDDEQADASAPEGAVQVISVNAYERSPILRARCIAHWGLRCLCCGFSFEDAYGPLGAGFIHVHHLQPLAELGTVHEVDPIEDLRPLCANCHAVIHRRAPALSLAELSDAISARRDSLPSPHDEPQVARPPHAKSNRH